MDLTEFYTNGFTSTIDKKIALLLGPISNINDWKLDTSGVRYPANVDLSTVHNYIAENYVYPIFGKAELGYNSIWEGTDKPSFEWHNDLIEGPNLFFMYYLSTVNNGGEICFRVNEKETGKLQPSKYLLVMGSQQEHIQHKVNPTNEERIVCNFGFTV